MEINFSALDLQANEGSEEAHSKSQTNSARRARGEPQGTQCRLDIIDVMGCFGDA